MHLRSQIAPRRKMSGKIFVGLYCALIICCLHAKVALAQEGGGDPPGGTEGNQDAWFVGWAWNNGYGITDGYQTEFGMVGTDTTDGYVADGDLYDGYAIVETYSDLVSNMGFDPVIDSSWYTAQFTDYQWWQAGSDAQYAAFVNAGFTASSVVWSYAHTWNFEWNAGDALQEANTDGMTVYFNQTADIDGTFVYE